MGPEQASDFVEFFSGPYTILVKFGVFDYMCGLRIHEGVLT